MQLGPRRSFVADWLGPPRRRFYLWQDPPIPNDAPKYIRSGWGFAVSQFDTEGREQPFLDFWEETYREILMYPPEYAPREIEWHDEFSGKVVDIYDL